MRIHRMRLEGLGPYAQAQDVDFDRLNAAGLFLLDGPTGAGKSTVLAALCFALYGTVPGGRSAESLVTTLREPGAVIPEVQVEFTVQGRRFEVVRSPKHERPRRRRSAAGGATVTTQATVSLRERVDGEWTAPLTRADEVGQQIAAVLHLDAEQFMQVVLLPQGQFAQFLTAKSDERRVLLRRLFGTQRFDGGWDSYVPPTPRAPGVHVFDDWPLDDLVDVIDWTPFFNAWELFGRYPAILSDDVVGAQASDLFRDAQAMLRTIIDEKWLTAKAVFGLWRANSVGDDVEVQLADHSDPESVKGHANAPQSAAHSESPSPDPRSRTATLHFLRQQVDKPIERPDFCLADFIAPKDSGVEDWIGAFAVTAGIGIEPHVARFEAAHDDYNAILLKALADRLAEALAERLHQRVRVDYWGYAADEALDNEALIAERYRGIRPAPGYPACPEHSEKGTLFDLLDAPAHAGMSLTESFAMLPTAAVSGYYFSHPKSQYFVVGRVSKEQVQDYAKRKNVPLSQVERWLASNLDYDPE